MSLIENVKKLRDLDSDDETIKLYADIYNNDVDDIPESWFEQQFIELMNIKYEGVIDKALNFSQSREHSELVLKNMVSK